MKGAREEEREGEKEGTRERGKEGGRGAMPSRASAGSEMMNQVVPMMWVLTTRPYLSGKGRRKL